MTERKCNDCGEMLKENCFHVHGPSDEAQRLAAQVEALKLQLGEARDLIQELLTWVGVDPSYQESVRMDDAQKRALAFLGKTLKRSCGAPIPGGHCAFLKPCSDHDSEVRRP